MLRKHVVLAFATLLTPAVSIATPVFMNDAATIGSSRLVTHAGISYGSEQTLNSDVFPAVRVGIDYGAATHVQLGLWAGFTYGDGICVLHEQEGRSDTVECWYNHYLEGGLRGRIGIVRSANDRFQLGLQGSLSLSRRPGIDPSLGIRVTAEVLASYKLGAIGLGYLHTGFAFSGEARQSSTLWPIAATALGIELLETRVHPFLEVTGGWYFAESFSKRFPLLSVAGGVSVSFGE